VRMGSILATLIMLEEGETLGDEFQLEGSLCGLAWHTALDTSCKSTIRLANGKTITPAELQGEFVERTEKYRDRFSDELKAVHEAWQEDVNAAQQGPAALSGSADWVLRSDVIERELERTCGGTDKLGRTGLSHAKVRAADLAYDRVNPKEPGKVPVPRRVRARDAERAAKEGTIWYPTPEDVAHYKYSAPDNTSSFDRARAIKYMSENRLLGMVDWDRVDVFNRGVPITIKDPREVGNPAIERLIAGEAPTRLPETY
jgi:proteasome accessory factor A